MIFPLFCRVLPSAEVDPPQLQLLHSHSSALKLYMVILQDCLCLFTSVSGLWLATLALDSAHLSNLLFLASFSPSFFSSSLIIHSSPPPSSLSSAVFENALRRCVVHCSGGVKLIEIGERKNRKSDAHQSALMLLYSKWQPYMNSMVTNHVEP